ncbi:hypothetical protein LEN26_000637 [Aphanomyces euteiches]|nr:hypothetical protein AeMF1_010088 [Aphanomyces euteiches]KAH9163130.1 hypothetical protein LEN26_000637 [Aphanomyces euteiches]KAH9193407.1 hypothetical protein AeNC1_004609 [Aphanomyces euteiches]
MSLLKSKHVDFDQEWQGIKPAVEVLLSGSFEPFSHEKWQSIYHSVYSICTNPGTPQDETLFYHLRDVLVKRVTYIADVLEEKLDDADFLGLYQTHFCTYSTGTNYVSELFSYLNRYWIRYAHSEYGQAPVSGVYPIPELALRIWRDIVYYRLKNQLVSAILRLFRQARAAANDYFEHGTLISSIVEIYISLGLNKQDTLKLYREDLEVPFLKDTENYYSTLADTLLSRISIAEYLILVEGLCKQEENRCEGKMHRTTVMQTRQTCCRVLVDLHAEKICEEVESFLDNNQIDDLRRLFLLFSELPTNQALLTLKGILKKYIERRGLEVAKSFEHNHAIQSPEEYIEALVDIRFKFFDLIKNAFNSHALMRTALDQACRSFANSHPRLPELLATYSHILMTKMNRGDDSAMEAKIENIGVVFCLLDDKDIFKHMYAKLLSNRLLQGDSASTDYEMLLVQKLRDVCGCDFVSKLQKMFSDKIMSNNINIAFKSWENSQLEQTDHNRSFDVSFDVLTAGVWPLSIPNQNEYERNFPQCLQLAVEKFASFYDTQSNGRRLHWVHGISNGLLRCVQSSKTFEFHVSYYQMILLLLYNQRNAYSEMELAKITGISVPDIRHNMQPLQKLKLITVCNPNATSSQDIYELNVHFAAKRSHIIVLPKMSQLRSPKAKSPMTTREVSEDRKMTMQAAIVRIMKARREYSFEAILSDATQMLSNQFVPSKAFLQQNLDLLVEKEYIRVAAHTSHGATTAAVPARQSSVVYSYIA